MIYNTVIKLLKKKQVVINGWLSIPNSFTAEAMGNMGWDSLTIDMQHGQNDYSTSISMLQAISNGNNVPFARVPWNEPGIIMKMLDLGCLGIISPMINTKEECENFVSYCKYPPIGKRSYGPMRSILRYGSNYYEHANKNIITLAMIETQEAIDNLEQILSVKHLDGIYLGPADMSLSFGLKPKFDVKENPVYSNIKIISKKAKKYNKIAGIHNGTIKYAKQMIKLGYNFITISSDYRAMTSHAENIINQIKEKKVLRKQEKSY